MRLRLLLGNFMEQFLPLFRNLLFEIKIGLPHKNLTKLLMNITIYFRMFLRKILVFLQMLIPPCWVALNSVFINELSCWERAPPVAKVMRKEAWHMQRRDRASGVPLEISSIYPPNQSLPTFCFVLSPTPLTLRGQSPTTSLWKKS